MKTLLIIFWILICPVLMQSQGYNNTWLLGYNTGVNEKARFIFDAMSYTYSLETRPMQFWGTEARISDAQGNFFMSSNGVWIANANNDTMLNGSGLNPGSFVNSWPDGLPLNNANVILPFPGDSNKLVLLHHTFDVNGISYSGFQIYKTIVDLTLDSGKGGVISKNEIVLTDTINQGIAACRHANGRDWWVISQKESSDILISMLLTPSGIENITYQSLGVPTAEFNVTQLIFSTQSDKFAYYRYDSISNNESVILVDFDRCSGLFSNAQVLPLTTGLYLWGMAFSSSGNYLYASSSGMIVQINTLNLSVDTVAIYDGFISGFPPNCCATTFWNMYLAANRKIYITSGSSVQHLHEMNYPDSAGVACDVQQHGISLGMWNFRAVPNHPNYYLGAADGTICDSLGLNSLSEGSELQQYFRIYPNPTNGSFSISYLLPENTPGNFEIFDVNGKQVFVESLPAWSNFQSFNISHLSSGIYNCIITSGKSRVYKKLIIQIK